MSGSQQLLLGTGVSAVAANYIEDVFSTYLYTGNGSTQTITNGINLSTNGGLVWTKGRGNFYANTNHGWFDTARGTNKFIWSNSTASQGTESTLTSFNTNGFSLGADVNYAMCNGNTENYVSWTFRKQAKFFDVVTYTGTGASNPVAHSLGSTPGCVIIKSTSASDNWTTLHRANGTWVNGALNGTFGLSPSGATATNAITSTTINVQSISNGIGENLNTLGRQYVMYLFAHNAGGFGLTGTDNVITCGGGTFDGSGYAVVNLGYEPQWVLIKSTTYADNWYLADTMRGTTALLTSGTNSTNLLYPNLSNAETATSYGVVPSATGFTYLNGSSGQGYIYIAIRRGPMKTPTSGTSVFAPYVTSSLNNFYNAGFVTDWVLQRNASNTDGWYTGPRLTGGSNGGYYMKTETTAAESFSSAARWDSNTGAWNFNPNYGLYAFQRAPGFFDVVCYTGTGSATTQAHNLGVAPELMIVKSRSASGTNWPVYSQPVGNNYTLYLNGTAARVGPSASLWNSTSPTASVFSVGTNADSNASGTTYVAYLFATVAGVSKVGSYTGTGALQTVNCGFTGGARFVLIKRTDLTGDWWVYDSARGISSGNDPYLLLNSTAAEVTGTNYVDTTSVGFQVTAAAPAGLNASGGTYIFLAVS